MKKTVPQAIGAKLATSGQAEVFEGFPIFFYQVKNPLNEVEQKIVDLLVLLSREEKVTPSKFDDVKQLLSKQFLEEFQKKVLDGISFSSGEAKLIDEEGFNELKQSLVLLFQTFVPAVESSEFASERFLDIVYGYREIGPLVRDENLEEIMVNSPQDPIFVFHKKFGMCKTNVYFSQKSIDGLIQKIARASGKTFDESTPFFNARLPGGNRVNVTSSSVTPNGVCLTIRKFNVIPLSIIDLIKNNTLNAEVSAFLWVMVEGLNVDPQNIIVTGGASSGKTTTLNVLISFVSRQERLITIEDPVELNLGERENWIQMEKVQVIQGKKEFSIDDLLRNSFRMRPDRILVGEVRGPEAQTLFVAMDTGHQGCMGTMHANTAKETLLRLREAPMEVPEIMIPLLDLIIVQYRMYIRGRGIIRRVTQVAEISSMEGHPLIANLFEWDRNQDKLKRTDIPSHIIEEFAHQTQRTKKDIMREISVRQKILEWLAARNITSVPEVEEVIERYYFDPNSVLELVARDMKSQVASF